MSYIKSALLDHDCHTSGEDGCASCEEIRSMGVYDHARMDEIDSREEYDHE